MTADRKTYTEDQRQEKRDYYLANKQKILERQRAYYLAHRQEVLDSKRAERAEVKQIKRAKKERVVRVAEAVRANRVRELRTKRAMSQVALAKAAGTSPQQIQLIESGATKYPRIDLAYRLADALGLPVEQVFLRPTS